MTKSDKFLKAIHEKKVKFEDLPEEVKKGLKGVRHAIESIDMTKDTVKVTLVWKKV